jgi:ABC-type transport system involved in cytochrome c biogenesis permease subunit
VFHFLSALRGLRLAVVAVWRDPETKALPVIVGLLLLAGTGFYWAAEGWTPIQSLYFSVITLTTVGYGDLSPTSDYSRFFTIVYLFVGLGVLVAFTSAVARHYIQHKVEVAERARAQLSAHLPHDQPLEDGGSQ